MGVYRDPDGSQRSAGAFSTRRAALRAAQREEDKVDEGRWHDASLGAVTFREYVEKDWLPSKHIEASTRAAYVSNLDKHFFPFFGARPMGKITASTVQDWVTKATSEGLSPRSVRKYHTMLHSIFKRAVRDRLIVVNPCEHTELPKVIIRKSRTLTPEEFDRLINAVPDRYRLMVETAIETGMRWGELIALRPRHVDFLRRSVTVEETIVEVSKKHSPTGERYIVKPYPKDNEPRTFGVRQDWLDALSEHIKVNRIGRDELLFTTTARHADLAEHLPDAGVAAGGQGQRRRLQRPHARPPARPRVLAPCRRIRPQERHGADGACADPDHAEVPAHPPRGGPEEPRRAEPDHGSENPGPLDSADVETADARRTTARTRSHRTFSRRRRYLIPAPSSGPIPAVRDSSVPERAADPPARFDERRVERLIPHR